MVIASFNSLVLENDIFCLEGESCNCRLCKIYIPQVGYLT